MCLRVSPRNHSGIGRSDYLLRKLVTMFAPSKDRSARHQHCDQQVQPQGILPSRDQPGSCVAASGYELKCRSLMFGRACAICINPPMGR